MQMKMAFLILIGAVFIVSIFFGFLIWRQTIKFEKKAFVAKEKLHQEIANASEHATNAAISINEVALRLQDKSMELTNLLTRFEL